MIFMPKYLLAGTYTAEGMKGAMKDGGSKRRDVVDQAIRSVGGKLESMYFAFGEHDVISIAEFPDQASAAAVSAIINASGASRTVFIPLITVEEVDLAAKKSVQYRAPGR